MINASKTIEQGDGIMGQRVSKGRGHSSRGGGAVIGSLSEEETWQTEAGRCESTWRKYGDSGPGEGTASAKALRWEYAGHGLRKAAEVQ